MSTRVITPIPSTEHPNGFSAPTPPILATQYFSERAFTGRNSSRCAGIDCVRKNATWKCPECNKRFCPTCKRSHGHAEREIHYETS